MIKVVRTAHRSAHVATRPGFVVWLTGRPGSGKTSIASALVDELRLRGLRQIEMLDGDALRSSSLSNDLGFSREDRDKNVRRVGFVAELLARNGVAVLVSLVSPYDAAREEVRSRIPNFVLVHVVCAPEELERRDPKGLYAEARRGEIAHLTGVSDPYERPTRPDLTIETDRVTIGEAVDRVLAYLFTSGHVWPGAEA
jgi:adenylylsulfate kinase